MLHPPCSLKIQTWAASTILLFTSKCACPLSLPSLQFYRLVHPVYTLRLDINTFCLPWGLAQQNISLVIVHSPPSTDIYNTWSAPCSLSFHYILPLLPYQAITLLKLFHILLETISGGSTSNLFATSPHLPTSPCTIWHCWPTSLWVSS